jgi:hypothetical protein
MFKKTTIVLLGLAAASDAFVPLNNNKVSAAYCSGTSTQLFGLFDGVKEAFKAPALERSTINSERETPIDRWMGWSVTKDNEGATGMSVQIGRNTFDCEHIRKILFQ